MRALASGDARRALLAQGGRYALAGSMVAVVYFTITTIMRAVVGAPWPLAVAVGYVIATSLHFTLQRILVFRHKEGFALSVREQLPRFAALVVCQYAVTISAMAVLPHLLGLPSLLVYFGVAGAITVVSFVILRTRLFHPRA
jgi:putative flippase GtrA